MNVARSFNNWLSYRRTVTELGRLSSHALQDLGISRDEIPASGQASPANSERIISQRLLI